MNVFARTVEWITTAAHWSGGDGVAVRIGQHLAYTGLTVALAAVIALPLGLWVGHTGRFRTVAVAATGALRALPTLGLLTLFALLVASDLIPTVVALTLLAIPPLLAGAYSGLESVDRETIDAARAQGMTEWQVLTRVEIPLAADLIVGGVRSAVLQVVATATVAAYVGLGGLGRYIFDGKAVQDYPQMLAGSVVVVVMALLLDAVFASIRPLTRRGSARSARRTAAPSDPDAADVRPKERSTP